MAISNGTGVRNYTVEDVVEYRERLYTAIGRNDRDEIHAAGQSLRHIYNYAMAGDAVRAAGRAYATYNGWLLSEDA